MKLNGLIINKIYMSRNSRVFTTITAKDVIEMQIYMSRNSSVFTTK